MDMPGVYQPDFGMLTDVMLYEEGDAIPAASLTQPKGEGVIAFVLKHDLQGPGVTAAGVLAATAGVVACFEIVDSRIRDWKIRIEDTAADNASCGVFVLGKQVGSLAAMVPVAAGDSLNVSIDGIGRCSVRFVCPRETRPFYPLIARAPSPGRHRHA
jgi:2-keto-4-pentenoate hydratase